MKPSAITKPLRVHPTNPRYFCDTEGKAVYLTGSHTWANLQDIGRRNGPAFPYDEYLDFMETYGSNFMRMWMFEQPERASWTDVEITFDPLPWPRTGPGLAADGISLIWTRSMMTISDACASGYQGARAGIYAAVMLFQGWSLHKTNSAGDPWPVHPFNGANNINGVDAPFGKTDDDENACLHSLLLPEVLETPGSVRSESHRDGQ